jgi:hypothetical protein
MGIFNFFKKFAAEQTESKPFTFENIFSLIDLTLKVEDAKIIKEFLLNKVEKLEDKSKLSENFEFCSQEIVDFMYEVPIYFYGFFDWKQESEEFALYIENALLRNFDIQVQTNTFCDLSILNSIDKVYKIFGERLNTFNITLCGIDIDSDSYQIMLVKNDDFEKVKQLAKNLGFEAEHYTEEW